MTDKQKGDFNTLSGYSDFTTKTTSYSVDKQSVTEIAKAFSMGTFRLHNPQDKALMSAFYQNLSAGQDPKTAAQNAYGTVPPSAVSQPMNALCQGLSGYQPA